MKLIERVFDTDGHERLTASSGTVTCTNCGRDVPLTRETEEWRETPGLRHLPRSARRCASLSYGDAVGGRIRYVRWWHHAFGAACGFCECGFAFHDGFDGMFALDLREKKKETSDVDA